MDDVAQATGKPLRTIDREIAMQRNPEQAPKRGKIHDKVIVEIEKMLNERKKRGDERIRKISFAKELRALMSWGRKEDARSCCWFCKLGELAHSCQNWRL